MRHITITILFLALCLGAVAQKPIRHPSTTTTTPSKPSTPSKPTKPTKPSKPAKRTNTTPSGYTVHAIHTPEAVDLGLSVKWASFNLGASKPEETGNYYAWGETKPNEDFDNSKQERYPSATTELKPEDDAATVNLGGKWRMPTLGELYELTDKCTCQWTTVNGVDGLKVAGSNGNSIFLPASGLRYSGGKLGDVGSKGYYWSVTSENAFFSKSLYFTSSEKYPAGNSRAYGFPIRPVLAE